MSDQCAAAGTFFVVATTNQFQREFHENGSKWLARDKSCQKRAFRDDVASSANRRSEAKLGGIPKK